MRSWTLRRVGVLSLIPALSVAVLGTITLAIPPGFKLSRETNRTPSAMLEDSASELDLTAEGVDISALLRVAYDDVSVAASSGGDNCNDTTPVFLSVGPAGSPNTIVTTGDTTPATANECNSGLGTVWWEAFEIDACARVTLDFCGTTPKMFPNFVLLMRSCAADGSSCEFAADNEFWSRGLCGGADENITVAFTALPPGTYYYPIIADSLDPRGPYVMHVSAEVCAGACSGCLGACCDRGANTCTDAVDVQSCGGVDEVWHPAEECCQVECRDPAGPEFSSSNVNFLGRVTIEDFAVFNGSPGDPHTANEMWGFTSSSGRDYAIIGFTSGTGIVEITDPRAPVIVAYIGGGGVDTIWRDMATYQDHLYIVTDGTGVGLQIVDLSAVDEGVAPLITTTGLGMGFVDAHNVYVNPDSGFLYLPLANLNGGRGFLVFSLSDPANPQHAGTWIDPTGDVRCHDLQVTTLTRAPYAGKEIAFCFAESRGLRIVDVTSKSLMVQLATLTYATNRYCHQGWISEDERFVFFGDELDELEGLVPLTTTYVANIEDLTAPFLAATYEHPGCWIDHNLMPRGDRVYQAHYQAGMRVLDVADPTNPSEVGFFDTHPEDNGRGFSALWGVFAGYQRRAVTASDRERGLFILCDRPERPIAGFVVDGNLAPAGTPVLFDGSGSTTCDPDRSVVTYEWDFEYDGATFGVAATGSSAAHAFAAAGVHTVALRVTDDLGAQDVVTFDVTATDAIPTVSQWGLIALALALLAAGTITLGRKRVDVAGA